MGTYFYPTAEWLAESTRLYKPEFEEKLKKLTGYYGFHIHPDPAFGIEKDMYMCMILDAGKLIKLAHCSEEEAKRDADFILGGPPKVWKAILTKRDKFVGALLLGRIKLEKGNTVAGLSLGPYANTLVGVITQVDLQFPDDLSPDELAEFKASL